MTSSSHLPSSITPVPSPGFGALARRLGRRRLPSGSNVRPTRSAFVRELIVALTAPWNGGNWKAVLQGPPPEGVTSRRLAPRAHSERLERSWTGPGMQRRTGALPPLLRTRPGGGLAPLFGNSSCRPCWPSWTNGPRPGWRNRLRNDAQSGSRGGSPFRRVALDAAAATGPCRGC